jgi:hypothetical protein
LTHAHVKKKKVPQHPYDKWVATRGKIAEAAVERRALIKVIADFIKVVLPNTTLTQKVYTPKRESAELGTQTVENLATPPPLPSTSSAGEVVYEAQTSPVGTAGLPTAAYAADDDDDDVRVVSDGDVRTFSRKSFGAIASPYLSPYVHKRGVLDAEYGLRKEGSKFFIGNSDVTVDTNSDLYIKDKHFKGRLGFWELLIRKSVNKKLVNEDDLKEYKKF